MNNSAALTTTLQHGLWTECAATATQLDNIITTTNNPSPFEKFYGKPSPLINKLRSFGKLGIIKTSKQHQSKLTNRGEACIFVGYTEDHSNSSYRMLNLRTHHVIVSRDIIWLNQMHGDDTLTNLIPPQEDELFEEDIKTQPDNVPSDTATPAPVQAPAPAPAPTPTPAQAPIIIN